MFSVIFPGQGSQIVGMAKDLHSKFEIVNKKVTVNKDNTKIRIDKKYLFMSV